MLEPGQHHAVNAWRRETFAPGTPSDATITERRLWAVIWATRYIYENGVRLYGPGNPPPSRFTSALNTISWEKNLDTGVITQWGFISLGDNTYSTIYLPIAFPTAFTSLVITPAVPGAIYASDVTAAGGKIIDNGSFGAGLSSNYNTPWAGAYFEAKGH